MFVNALLHVKVCEKYVFQIWVSQMNEINWQNQNKLIRNKWKDKIDSPIWDDFLLGCKNDSA